MERNAKKMRYGFLTYGPFSNAGYIRSVQLGRCLLDFGVEVAFIGTDIPQNHGYVDSRAEVHLIPPGKAPSIFLRRRKLISRLKLDYLEVIPDMYGQSLFTLIGTRQPRVVGFWDEAAVFKTSGHAKPVLWFSRIVDAWLRRRATLCLTSTREHQRYWEARHSKPITYMPHACYLTDEKGGDDPFTEPTLVYMGSINDTSWDHDLFFDSLRLLKQEKNLTPALFIMGTGRLMPKWQAFCQEHGLNVTFGGFMTGAARFQHLRHARALLFPLRDTLYHKTRCPSKTLAYAQAQRPIITCRVGEIAEMLGDKAIYVEPTAEGFAAAILDIMSRQDVPDAPYDTPAHTWQKRAEALLELLH